MRQGTQHASLTLERWARCSLDRQAEAQTAWPLRGQLLRWRERAGIVHLEPDEAQHLELFRELLSMTPESARQLPFLMAEPRPQREDPE
jgi:hypothetical protein